MTGAVLAAYRWALRLLPGSFRRQYGDAMVDEARADLHEARKSGAFARVGALARLGGDFVATWIREWTSVVFEPIRHPRWSLVSDVRLAIRSIRRAPAFAGTVILTLAVGIGANTAIFSIINATLLRPLPYDAPNELIAVWPGKLFSRALMDDAQTSLRTVQGVAGFSGSVFTLTDGGDPVELFGFEVTPNYFDVLRVGPAQGRLFTAEDGAPGSAPVAVLSHRIWMERFGGSTDVIGQSVELQSEGLARRVVVGVLPADHIPLDSGVEIWIPVVTDPTAGGYSNSSFMEGIARMTPGTDTRQAAQDVASFAASQREADPGMISERDVAGASAISLLFDRIGSLRTLILALFGSVGIVLLIACVNVANLLLARTSGRTRMLGIRSALGAGRGRIFSQLLTEGVVLSLLGGVLGVGIALLTRGLLVGILPVDLTPAEVPIDLPVLAFTLGVSVLCGLVFGTLPALQGSRSPGISLSGSDRSGSTSPGAHRLRHALMAAEVGLALVAIFAAGLLGRSARDLARVDTGFEPDSVLTLRLTAPPARYPTDEEVVRYFERVRDEVVAIPGVESAGVVGRLPLGGGRSEITIYPEDFEPGPDGELPDATHRLVSPGYAEAMGFRLLEGRLLSESDVGPGEPILGYVNRTLAERHWPDGAVGRSFLGPGGVTWLTVVGVVEDVREDALTGAVKSAVYIPHRDWAWRTMWLSIRTSTDLEALVPSVEAAAWSIDPTIPVTRVRSMRRVVEASYQDLQVTSLLFSIFGGLALFLGVIGVYGVVAHTLGERRREFGIRLALGATVSTVTREAIRRAILAVGLGLVVGLVAAPYIGTLLNSSIEGVRAGSTAILIAASGALSLVAVAAAWFSARNATRVDPIESLRSE